MNIFVGLIIAVIGLALLGLGIKMFIKSDAWFYLFKAILVILLGLVIFGLSFDNKLELLL
jgi:glucose dehydrogenase